MTKQWLAYSREVSCTPLGLHFSGLSHSSHSIGAGPFVGLFWGRVVFSFELITFIAQELQSSLKICCCLTPRQRQSVVKEPLRDCGMPGRGWLMEYKWLAPGQDDVLDYCC